MLMSFSEMWGVGNSYHWKVEIQVQVFFKYLSPNSGLKTPMSYATVF